MKGSKAIKVVGILLGFLFGVVLLGAVACAFAGLLMFLWNVIGVAALSISVPLTFLTALKGVGILYGVLTLWNIVRSVIQGYLHKRQMQATLESLRQFGVQTEKKEGDSNILEDFFRNH